MPQPRLSAALRGRLAVLDLEIHAYQPIAMFRTARKLALVAEPGDPWHVTLYRKGHSSWSDEGRYGAADGDTLDAAVEAALASRRADLLSAVNRLTIAVDDLVRVIRR